MPDSSRRSRRGRLRIRLSFGLNSGEPSNLCLKAPEHSPYGGRRGSPALPSVWPRLIRLGRRRVVEYLELGPFPHYQPIPGSPGLVVRVDADGTRTSGRFVGREFQAVPCP